MLEKPLVRFLLVWILIAVLMTCPLQCVRCGEVGVENAGDRASLEGCGGCCQSHRLNIDRSPAPMSDGHRGCDCRFCAFHGALPPPSDGRFGADDCEYFRLEEFPHVQCLKTLTVPIGELSTSRFGFLRTGAGFESPANLSRFDSFP